MLANYWNSGKENDELHENLLLFRREKGADGVFERVQQDKQLVGIGGSDTLREYFELIGKL